jgi:hypothetical protein
MLIEYKKYSQTCLNGHLPRMATFLIWLVCIWFITKHPNLKKQKQKKKQQHLTNLWLTADPKKHGEEQWRRTLNARD